MAVLWKVRHSAAGGNYRRWTRPVVGSPSASYAYIELAANTLATALVRAHELGAAR
jgi:hypothetical protein